LAENGSEKLVYGSGGMEFGGVPTYTAITVGLGDPDQVAALTGHMKLR
jgi:hypothetical protein